MTIVASLPGSIVTHICHLVPTAQRTHVVRYAVEFVRAHCRWVLRLLAVIGQVQFLGNANAMVQLASADAFGLESLQVDHQHLG